MSNFIVGQIGIPRNSVVPKMLYKNNILDRLVTDNYFSENNFLSGVPVIGKKLINKLKKYDMNIPAEYVSGDILGAIYFRNLLKYSDRKAAFKLANSRLGKRVISFAKEESPGKIYGSDTVSIGFMPWAYANGWKCYLEQTVAPRVSQIKMWELFKDKYGINIKKQIDYCLFQQEIERKEWKSANNILVPSDYVKNELATDPEFDIGKISMVNYGYTPLKEYSFIKETLKRKFDKYDNSINIFFAGHGGYRKGLADLLIIAQMLLNENINFVVAGQLEEEIKTLIRDFKGVNVTFLGKLTREEMSVQYMEADIFFFPSYLEGSALVLMEAMSWGLPIVTTFQSGSVVKKGINGLISEAGDVESLRDNIMKLVLSTEKRYNMSVNALESSSNYSVEKYGLNLLNTLNQ